MNTNTPIGSPARSRNIWNSKIFRETGTRTTNATGTYLLMSKRRPTTTSVAPIKYIKYPDAIKAPKKAPASGDISGAGKKFKNLFSPNKKKTKPSKYLAMVGKCFIIISDIEFVIIV